MEPQRFNLLQTMPPDAEQATQAGSEELPTEAAPRLSDPHAMRLLEHRALIPLPEADTQALFATMRREARRNRMFHRFSIVCTYPFLGVVLLPSLFPHLLPWHLHDPWRFLLYSLVLVNMLIEWILNGRASKINIARLTADVRAVGPLAEALSIQETDVNSQVQQALTSLLPRLQATDSALLNTEQRHGLHRALRGENQPLALAILKALEQVGDSRDLAAVQHCIDNSRRSDKAFLLGEAAEQCLPYLHANIKREQANRTLLRASSSVSATSDTLLRAAHAQTVTPSEQLLRVASNNTEHTA